MSDANREAITTSSPRVEAALIEYFAMLDRGEAADLEAFLHSHAEIATELRSFIAFDGVARRMAQGGCPPVATPSNTEASTRSEMSVKEQTSTGKPKKKTISRKSDVAISLPGELPKIFGRYQVDRILGAGAMGAVYLAKDTLLDRDVALKTPTFENDENGELLKRFYREARAVSKIKHRNLCGVYDVGEIEGRNYISMEFVPGKKLTDYIKAGKPMSEKQATAIVRKIALAMHEAHSHEVIHRDLKPDNIMINQKGEPVVMDFGLVHQIDSTKSVQLSRHGALIGSPAYMSKEQVEGDHQNLTPATDQYSLGVILYQLLTFRLPFEGSLHAVLGAILTQEPPLLRQYRPDVNPQLEAVCMKMMAKHAAERFPSMKAVAEALAQVAKTSKLDEAVTVSRAIAAPLSEDLAATVNEAPFGQFRLHEAFAWKPSATTASHLSHVKWIRSPRYAVAFAGVVFLLAVIFWFRDGQALIKVKVLSDDVEVTFHDATITLADGSRECKVKPGDHTLHIKSGDTEFDTDTFTLKRGKVPLVMVTLVDSEIVAKLDDKEIGRRSLGVSPAPHPGVLEAKPNSTNIPEEEWVDLLALVDLSAHTISGKWTREGSSLVCEPTRTGGLMIPITIEGSYEIQSEFTRRTAEDFIAYSLPLHGAATRLVLGGFGSSVHGLTIHDMRTSDAGLEVRPGTLVNGRRYVLRASVTDVPSDISDSTENSTVTVKAELDGQEIVSWTGDSSRLFLPEPLPNPNAIGLSAFQSVAEFHSLRLKLKKGSRAVLLGKDWKNPLDVVAEGPPESIAAECIERNGKKYFIGVNPMVYSDAQQLAKRHQGRLLTISSDDEDRFIRQHVQGRQIWMVGMRFGDGLWRDERNRPLRYTAWAQGDPRPKSEDFVMAIEGDGLGWHNYWLYDSKHACIEWGEEYPAGNTTDGWYGWPANAPKPAVVPFDAAQAKRHQQAWADYLQVPVEHTNSLGMRFVLIPPGEFVRGMPAAEINDAMVTVRHYKPVQDYLQGQKTIHTVALTEPKYVGIHEVTQAQYQQVMNKNPSGTQAGRLVGVDTTNHPVDSVNWFDAITFCSKLSQLEKLDDNGGYCLPTEAEWQFACGAGATTKYWNGNSLSELERICWFEPNAGNLPHPVGKLAANPFGLFDVHGNVVEWCHDRWDENYLSQFQSKIAVDPRGPASARNPGIVRGGDFHFTEFSCRNNIGFPTETWYCDERFGFRVVLPLSRIKLALKANVATKPPESIDRRGVIAGKGNWHIEGDELLQTTPTVTSLLFGSCEWTDYDFQLELMREGGSDGIQIFFRSMNLGNSCQFNLGSYGNKWHEAVRMIKNQWGRDVPAIPDRSLPNDEWQKVLIKVRGDRFSLRLNDEELFHYTESRFPCGLVGIQTFDCKARFRNLKVTDPAGKILWEGLPGLPQAQ
jgi:serine/threonine protein kinase/formylglycine-generating enzyme required for sulfatase activity